MSSILVVLTTVPNAEVAGAIARQLVEARLAACVSVLPAVRSFYWWEGKVSDDQEVLLIAKIREDQVDAYEARMREIHPYQVPEIVAVPVAAVHEPYLRWVLAEGMPPQSSAS